MAKKLTVSGMLTVKNLYFSKLLNMIALHIFQCDSLSDILRQPSKKRIPVRFPFGEGPFPPSGIRIPSMDSVLMADRASTINRYNTSAMYFYA